MASKKQQTMLREGALAPDFQLEDLSGERRSLSGMRRPALLAFFKAACPTCQYTFPFLERLHRGSDVEMYAISQDDRESTEEFRREFEITMPALLDPADDSYPASNAYGLSHVPSIFWIEPDGRISLAFVGFEKKGMEELGRRLGTEPFEPGEYVPEWKSG